MSAAVNLFDGVDWAAADWFSLFVTLAFEQAMPKRETATRGRTKALFRILAVSIFGYQLFVQAGIPLLTQRIEAVISNWPLLPEVYS